MPETTQSDNSDTERKRLVERVAVWLASAHPRPAEVHKAWRDPCGMAELPCNGPFTVVRLPSLIVHAAVGTDDRDAVSAQFGKLLDGPVFCEPGAARYCPLVPADTAKEWQLSRVECLGPGCCVDMPSPATVEPSGQSAYWAVPLDEPGRLCDPEAVHALTRQGQKRATAQGVRWCAWHKDYTHDAQLVGVTGKTSMTAVGQYACSLCRTVHGLRPIIRGEH
ncbi:hypothetical protein [Streptomyces sp. NPDC050560]|uniref:hypothetical protein n=1 Tax=Streptomyces sp. NPDC050560 TaxID=3365630 RepID=UPI0037937D1B